MKISTRTFLVFFIAFLGCQNLFAQQEVIYSQYMFNGLVINPAYAGQHESISLMAMYRRQWVGQNLDGAPATLTACLHSPLKNKRAGLGLLFTNDQIGVTSQNAANLYFSYRILFNQGAKLSFGLQGGFTQYRYDFNRLTYKTNNDPAFSATGDQNFFLPNFGFGMYYSSKTLFAGISIPQIMQHFVNSQEIAKNAIQLRYYLFYGGYLVKVSPNLVFKPSTLIKFSPGVPMQFDVNAAFLIRDALWLMLSYRTLNMVNASFQLNLNESLSIGYAYQQSLGGYSGGFGGTHEIMLNYRFKIGVSDVVNPRYF